MWIADGTIESQTLKDVNGIPTVDLGLKKSITVVVTNTNPLLYTATPGKITLQPIDQFSDLQKLAGLIGGNLSAILAARGSQQPLIGQAGSPIHDATKAFTQALDDYLAGQRLADCTAGYVQRATNFVQAVELDRSDSYPRDPLTCPGQPVLTLTGETVRNLAQGLVRGRETLTRRCPELPEAVVEIVTADPTNEAEIFKRIAAYEDTIPIVACTNWQATADVVGDVKTRIIDRIQAARGNPTAMRTLFLDFDANLKESVKSLAMVVRKIKTAGLEEPLGKLVSAWPAVGKAAENLDTFRERLLQNVVHPLVVCTGAGPDLCVQRSDVAKFIVVPGGPSLVTRWEFVHSRPIKIAPESPYAADIVAQRASVDTSFNLRSNLASIFDVGVSLTRTDLQAPTFGAVKRKTTTDPTETTRVTVVDQETQSGKFALMLNIVPLRLFNLPKWKWIQPLGVQIGAATDTTKPALFWGVSYGLGKYVRVGWGETSQRISMLRDETPLDSPIASKDDIRMRKAYENDHYFSLMVSIRALRLFAAP